MHRVHVRPQPREPWNSTHWPKVVEGMLRQCSNNSLRTIRSRQERSPLEIWKIPRLNWRKEEMKVDKHKHSSNPKDQQQDMAKQMKMFWAHENALLQSVNAFSSSLTRCLGIQNASASRDHHINLGENIRGESCFKNRLAPSHSETSICMRVDVRVQRVYFGSWGWHLGSSRLLGFSCLAFSFSSLASAFFFAFKKEKWKKNETRVR